MAATDRQVHLGILGQMIAGYARTQVLYVAAKLGVPDHIASGPKTAEEVAAAVGAHPPSLRRLLRGMVALQLATEGDGGRFRLAPLGEYLRSTHPDSLRPTVLYAGEANYPAAGGLLHTVRTGETAFDHVFGTSYFEYLGRNREVGEWFDTVMSRVAAERAEAVVRGCDLSDARLVVDLGGGNGTLLAAIAAAHPRARGLLYDRPAVAAAAAARFAEQGLADRCRAEGGDFFEAVPRGGDVYILANVIHDWDDARAVRILARCAGAMGESSRLLVIEEIVPEESAAAPSVAFSDLAMMILTGGSERTRGEFEALLRQAGLATRRVLPLTAPSVAGRQPTWAAIEAYKQFVP